MAKKTEAPVATRDDIDEHRESKIVTVKYKKSLKPRMQQLEKLLASSTPKGSERSDRSASVDRPPAPAKKRPPPTAEANSEPGPKKSRLSTGQAASSKPRIAAPTTPLKNSTGTAMRRVLSNTSQANTPGDTTGLTPGAAERPSTSSDSSTHVVDPAVAARNRALRNRSDEFTRLGTKLKRAKDAIVGKPPRPMSGPEEKRAAALHFEMILAYMIAFKALNDGTPVGHPSLSFQAWESLLPHFVELRNRFRSWRPLHALAIQVQAVILEEITQVYSKMDCSKMEAQIAARIHGKWAGFERQRHKMWSEAQTMLENGGLPEPKWRVNINPGSDISDITRGALSVLRRWSDREAVDWKAEIDLASSSSAVNGA